MFRIANRKYAARIRNNTRTAKQTRRKTIRKAVKSRYWLDDWKKHLIRNRFKSKLGFFHWVADESTRSGFRLVRPKLAVWFGKNNKKTSRDTSCTSLTSRADTSAPESITPLVYRNRCYHGFEYNNYTACLEIRTRPGIAETVCRVIIYIYIIQYVRGKVWI